MQGGEEGELQQRPREALAQGAQEGSLLPKELLGGAAKSPVQPAVPLRHVWRLPRRLQEPLRLGARHHRDQHPAPAPCPPPPAPAPALPAAAPRCSSTAPCPAARSASAPPPWAAPPCSCPPARLPGHSRGSARPRTQCQQHGHGEARPQALLCPRALCRAPHGCSPGLMALPRAAPRSPAALASSGSAPPGSTCTRSWVRSRTQEPKVSPRAGGRGAGSPLPRYSLSSQARGLTPLGSAGPQGSGRAPGDGAARGGARAGT